MTGDLTPDAPENGRPTTRLREKLRAFAHRARNDFSYALADFGTEERILFLIIIAYLVLFLIYALSSSELLFSAMLVSGAVLAFLIPELASKRNLGIRVSLSCVPVVCVAIGGRISEQKADRQILRLEEQLRESSEAAKDFQRQQALYSERIIIDPGSIARGMKHGDRGFNWKFEYLTLGALLDELKILDTNAAAPPEINPHAGNSSKDVVEEVAAYVERTFKDESSLPMVSALKYKIELAAEYRLLAKFVAGQSALYNSAEELAAKGNKQAATEQLRTLSSRLMATGLGKSGGYYSQLGTLALGYDNREKALGLLYQGLALDPDHIPLYESLAYSLWAFNQDTRTSLEYVVKGMERLQKAEREVSQNCAAANEPMKQSGGDWAALFVERQKLCDSLKGRTYVTHFTDSFKNLFVTNSAIAMQNETEARRFATELRNKYPDDEDYAENLAFVESRFDWTREALLSAGRCLLTVKRLTTDPIARDIVTSHYEKLVEKLKRLRISESLIPQNPQDTLSQACPYAHSS